jgi:imidazolonepropionase-like amidohydrolase
MQTLDVLKSATYHSARTLGEPQLGLVRPGYKADLLLVDGNPSVNLKYLYSFGDLTLDKSGRMIRTNGIVHTIKDGIVLNNAKLMDEVERMVQASRKLAPPKDPVRDPFRVGAPPAGKR